MADFAQDPIYERDFGEGFLRKVLSLCARAGLHRRVPGALVPAYFAGLADSHAAPPRQRIAALIERHAAAAPGGWPGVETMDQLVDRERARMRPDEATALAAEWSAVRAVEVTDASYVESEVRGWAARVGFARALLAASELYQKGATAAELRAKLTSDLRGSDPSPSGVLVDVLATYAQRVRMWERGEEVGQRVPTGLRPLDEALDGGVRKGEVIYALAPPKGAKTTFQLNLALNASRLRFGAALFSFEMGSTPMLLRADRNVARASKQELREDPARLARAYAGLVAAGAGDLHVWTGSPLQSGAVDQIVRTVEDLRREGYRVDEVCADFLNIMGPAATRGGGDREKRHELADVSREMSAAAKALDVAWWSACLVRRAAIAKPRLKKDDIAECFEVIAVADGVVGICAPEELVQQRRRSLYVAALREAADARSAGVYDVDLDRMSFYVAQDPPPGPGGQQGE